MLLQIFRLQQGWCHWDGHCGSLCLGGKTALWVLEYEAVAAVKEESPVGRAFRIKIWRPVR